MATIDLDRNLLFGVLAFQDGLIDDGQLLDGFRSWALDKGRPLADHLAELRYLDDEQRTLVDRLVAQRLGEPGGQIERGLVSILASLFQRESLDGAAEPDLDETIARPDPGLAWDRPDREPGPQAGDAVGSCNSDGQRFRVLRRHAEGGLGVVSVALDTELHREVAYKQIHDRYADDLDSRRRFVREAEVTGRLEHPGIVPVYGLGIDDRGRPYYAMRFIEGESLEVAIERFHVDAATGKDPGRRTLGLRQWLRRLIDVCNAVEYAHSRHVLHRDIKPANIIVGRYGETLLVDWGLAKAMGRLKPGDGDGGAMPISAPEERGDATMPGRVLGTPSYMSPEQAEGRTDRLGPRTDVYGLGATLYAILTGRPPIEGGNPTVILSQVRAGAFARPRQVDPAVPAALEAICLKAMARDPEGRYATPQALGEDIERWLADEPVQAYPEPLPARVMRRVRRHKPWVVAAAAVLLLAAVGLAIHDRQIGLEKARTAEQLDMTRDALRELLKVSGENLAFLPNTEALREHLARLVLDRYQRLGAQFPTDPGVRLEEAQVFRVIGGIGRITGQFAQAQESYGKAIGLLTGLCEADPGRQDHRRWLAEVLMDRGELNHMNGRTLAAEDDLRAAIDQADRLESPPISPVYRRLEGSAQINLSEILTLRARYAEARAAADRAVGLLRPLAADATSDSASGDRWLLSLALTARGSASGEAGDRAGAALDLDEAARVVDAVACDDEVYDDAQFQLACVANRRGELARREGSRLAEAEGYYEQASRILARLIENHERIPHYREEMAATLCGRAAARFAAYRIPEAGQDCEAALGHLAWLIGEQVRKGATENPQYLSLLGRVRARQGRIQFLRSGAAEGRQAFEEAVDKLGRAVSIDPAREADRATLERIKADPAQWDE